MSPWTPTPTDPKGISKPKVSKPAIAQSDIRLIRECITFYLNKNDFELQANNQSKFNPTDENVRKREHLLKIIHRLGRINDV
jgi:hypothetical protein